jgi:hypothetical protein
LSIAPEFNSDIAQASRPARFVLNAGVTHAALSSIVPAESRFAFSHRPFRPMPSGIKNSSDISAVAASFII